MFEHNRHLEVWMQDMNGLHKSTQPKFVTPRQQCGINHFSLRGFILYLKAWLYRLSGIVNSLRSLNERFQIYFMDYLQKIITDIEIHSAAGIKECFEHGIHPNDQYKNKPLIYELITEYLRGPGFKECVRVFVDYGLNFEDKILLAVLMDDAISLEDQLSDTPQALDKRYSFDCAFTPLYDVSLLHICAEYNHVACARVLVKYGADINAVAGVDENGFGGHTPIFHTVNQFSNSCIDMVRYLITQSADLSLTVKGLVWGKAIRGKPLFLRSIRSVMQ